MALNPMLSSLVLALALISAFNSYFKWDKAPNLVPIWWDAEAHPIYYVPKWVGFSIFPVLIFLIPNMIMLSGCDEQVQNQRRESEHAVHHLILLPDLFLFVVHNFVILDTFVGPTGDLDPHFFVACIAVWLMMWAGFNFQYVERNSKIGIVTPWTIKCDYVWDSTHAHSAWILMFSGLVLLICTFTMKAGISLLVVTLVLWWGSYIYLIFFSAWASSCVNDNDKDVSLLNAGP